MILSILYFSCFYGCAKSGTIPNGCYIYPDGFIAEGYYVLYEEDSNLRRGDKKGMLKKTGCLGVLLGILLSVIAVAGIVIIVIWADDRRVNSDESTRRRITSSTGIEIPIDSKIVYHFYQAGFQDSIEYTAFKFENGSPDWLKENSFSEGKNEDFESSFNSYFSGWIKDRVPEEYIPEFENSYFWLETQNNYLIYFPHNLMLIVYITPF